MIVIGATIDFADEASRDAAVHKSAPIQWATRQDEAGCHAYCFAADPCVATRIQVYELWEDEASLAAHFGHANYFAMREAFRTLGITGAWNRLYLVERSEPVYGPNGEIRTKFFVDDPSGAE